MRGITRDSDLRYLHKLPPTPKEGPLDLIAEDRRRKVKPVKREAHRRYSPLKDHVSRLVFSADTGDVDTINKFYFLCPHAPMRVV